MKKPIAPLVAVAVIALVTPSAKPAGDHPHVHLNAPGARDFNVQAVEQVQPAPYVLDTWTLSFG